MNPNRTAPRECEKIKGKPEHLEGWLKCLGIAEPQI